MNNTRIEQDAAIFRPHNRSLEAFIPAHRESVHLPLTLYLVEASISVVKPAVLYGDGARSHEHDMNRLKATPVLCLSHFSCVSTASVCAHIFIYTLHTCVCM